MTEGESVRLGRIALAGLGLATIGLVWSWYHEWQRGWLNRKIKSEILANNPKLKARESKVWRWFRMMEVGGERERIRRRG